MPVKRRQPRRNVYETTLNKQRWTGHAGLVRTSISTVRDLRESAVHFRNGRQAARIAAGYAGLVVLVAVVVVFTDVALGGQPGSATVALFVATLPGSLGVLVVVAMAPGVPETSGMMASGLSLVHVGLFTSVGLAQSWVLWRVGRGPRTW